MNALLEKATVEEKRRYLALLRLKVERWMPMEHQRMPALEDDWDVWAMVGGRGIGKTDGGAVALDRLLTDHPGWRARIIAPTQDDAKEACVDGPTGLKAHNAAVTVNYKDRIVLWPNGSRARWYGMNEPDSVERLRAGGNIHVDWFEELAAQHYAEDGWTMADLGRRLGRRPRVIVTTTPKNRPIMRWLLGKPLSAAVLERFPWMKRSPKVAITTASTDQNPHLEADRREKFYDMYGGTRLGEQELQGKLLEDTEGAMFFADQIEADRVVRPLQKRWLDHSLNDWLYADDLSRVVVAVDPTGSKDGDDVGIVVAGFCPQDKHGYILADRTAGGMSPEQWGHRAVQAYVDHKADRIVGETNFGGDMVISVIEQAATDMGVRVKVGKVTASRGKTVRAEPIAQLYEQHRIHHVQGESARSNPLALLEEELTTWTPFSGYSPNRLDALVWALTELMPAQGRVRAVFHAA